MKWIGVTGGIACGKSTVMKFLREQGFSVLQADQVAHLVFELGTPTYDQVIQIFGEKILDKKNEIDRVKISEIVFKNKSKLSQLESLVHPFVRNYVAHKKEQWSSEDKDVAFYEIPLLYEKNLQDQFDAVIVVSSHREKQLQRMQQERGWSQEESLRRLSHQLDVLEKVKRADYVIENNESEERLKQNLNHVLDQLLPAPGGS